MSKIYAMSDIHGCIDKFEEMVELVDFSGDNKLILLGDYLDRMHNHPEVLTYFMNFQKEHPETICLMGNHEEEELIKLQEAGAMAIDEDPDVSYIRPPEYCAPLQDAETLRWLERLLPYYETEDQIFVHAGIDEEAEDLWKYACEEYYFYSKYPWTEGEFLKDIIAGHVGTATIRKSNGLPYDIIGKSRWNDVYWDGKSHYFIDGSTETSGVLPLLIYDTDTKQYGTYLQDEATGNWNVYSILKTSDYAAIELMRNMHNNPSCDSF